MNEAINNNVLLEIAAAKTQSAVKDLLPKGAQAIDFLKAMDRADTVKTGATKGAAAVLNVSLGYGVVEGMPEDDPIHWTEVLNSDKGEFAKQVKASNKAIRAMAKDAGHANPTVKLKQIKEAAQALEGLALNATPKSTERTERTPDERLVSVLLPLVKFAQEDIESFLEGLKAVPDQNKTRAAYKRLRPTLEQLIGQKELATLLQPKQ